MKSFKQYLNEKDNEALAAGALFKAKDTGRYCVGFRSKICDTPHTYGPVGGSAADDETPMEAVIREVGEEIGIKIHPHQLELLDVFYAKKFSYHTFLCHIDKESDLNDNLIMNAENEHMRWFHANLPPEPLHPGFAVTYRKKVLDLT